MEFKRVLAKNLLESLIHGEWDSNMKKVENFIDDIEIRLKHPGNIEGTKAFNKANESAYDDKGNSKHYSDQRVNVIHMLEAIWGTEATMTFCEMNAFKYRMRIGKKDDPKLELTKISWYEKMASFLFNKGQKVSGLGTGTIPLPEKFQQLLNK